MVSVSWKTACAPLTAISTGCFKPPEAQDGGLNGSQEEPPPPQPPNPWHDWLESGNWGGRIGGYHLLHGTLKNAKRGKHSLVGISSGNCREKPTANAVHFYENEGKVWSLFSSLKNILPSHNLDCPLLQKLEIAY